MTDKKECIYEIGGKKYVQRPLVLGQVVQIIKLLKGIIFHGVVDAYGMVAAVGDRLPEALAIVLTPEGGELRNKDVDALSLELAFSISPDTTVQVVTDFFECNPIVSLSERLSGMAEKITETTKITRTALGSKDSSVSSQAET